MILEVKGLSKRYPGKAENAVNRINLEAREGELLALIGESGCGKTTTLKLIAGLEEPDTGEILLEGKEVIPPSQQLVAGNPDIKMVFQHYHLEPNVNIYHNLSSILRGYNPDYQQSRIKELLKVCKLDHLKDKFPRELSGGEKQRVAIARAIADEPTLLLLDEPFSNLDPALRQELKHEIKDIIKSFGTTAIFVTHETSDALAMADRIAIMRKGSILQIDTPQNLYKKPINAYVASFFGNANILTGSQLAAIFKQYATTLAHHKTYCIRAEDIKVDTPESTSATASVRRITFMGAYDEIEIITVNQIKLIIYSTSNQFQIGQEINIFIESSAIIALED